MPIDALSRQDAAKGGGATITHPQLVGDLWHQARRPAHRSAVTLVRQGLRARAGLNDVRFHDLRHSFASAAVAAGQGLPMIGKLLGHAQVQTTARYAHLAANPVKAAVEQVSRAIALELE